MRLFPFIVLLSAIALNACAITDGPNISKKAADKVWPADTKQERAIRVCMASAIVAEIWVYRLTWEGSTPDERASARGVINNMIDSVQQVRQLDENSPWFETTMFYSVHSLIGQAAPLVKDRILTNIKNALTGNIGGLVTELRTTAGQIALTDAMIRDISPIFESEDPDIDAAWEACETRLRFNLGRL